MQKKYKLNKVSLKKKIICVYLLAVLNKKRPPFYVVYFDLIFRAFPTCFACFYIVGENELVFLRETFYRNLTFFVRKYVYLQNVAGALSHCAGACGAMSW